MRIDFVSDVVCPWCAIGLWSLEEAIRRSGVAADVHLQPFELNPEMPTAGEDILEHLATKYGGPPEQFERSQAVIRDRGAEVGFVFDMEKRGRIYNTFDAHRLLHWAELEGKGLALKRALMTAYFTDGRNISDHAILSAIADNIALVGTNDILRSDAYAAEVRERERYYLERGVHGVPAVIIDGRHLISGGQPVAVFEQALRELAAAPSA